MLSRISSVAAAALLVVSGSVFAGTTIGSGSSSKGIDPFSGATVGLEPPPSLIVSNAGMEWVWASPCASEAPSCDAGVVKHHGFADPTASQWATWGSLAALQAAFAGGGPCASPYFSLSWDHCDAGDLAVGAVWHSPLADPAFYDNGASETFLVRGVPEPGTYALMLAGLGLVGYLARRRQQRGA